VVSKQAPPSSQLISSLEIQPSIPLRLFSVNGKSAYSLASRGLWPFEISRAPVDRVGAYLIGERKADLSWVTPADQQQVLRGLSPDGWSGAEATAIVKHTAGPLSAEFTIHPQSTARHIRLLADGVLVAEGTFPAPGSYALSAPPLAGGATVTVTLAVDKTFSVAGDGRQLGILITGIGFK